MLRLAVFAAALAAAGLAHAQNREHVVGQKNKVFSKPEITVKPGDTVVFKNDDDVTHHIYSSTKGQEFDLQITEPGKDVRRTFSQKGRVDVRCKVHDHMKAFIHVVDSPHRALAAADGTFTLQGVPPGSYTLVAWKEEHGFLRQAVEVKADGAKVEAQFARAAPAPARETACGGCSAR